MSSHVVRKWKQRLRRIGLGRPVPRRAAARNVVLLWVVAALGIVAGVALKMYSTEGDVLRHAVQGEWQAGVDKLSTSVPDAVVWVTGHSSWEDATLASALPRQSWGDEVGAGVEGTTKSPWRRIVDLGFAIILGYDVHDDRAVLSAALPTGEPDEPPRLFSEMERTDAVTGRSDDEREEDVRQDAQGDGREVASNPLPGPDLGENLLSSVSRDDYMNGEPTVPVGRSADGGVVPATESTRGNGEGTRLTSPGPPQPQAPTTFADDYGRSGGQGVPSGEEEARTTMTDRLERIRAPGRDDPALLPHTPSSSCRVLIFHSHTSETYRTNTFSPDRPDEFHIWNTTDTGIVHVGRALARALDDKFFVPTCHLTDIHDWPSHARAYIESRETVEAFLRHNPQVELVLDVHRDSPPDLVTAVAGRTVARVAVVVGTHPTMHPDSATNVATARHIGRIMEGKYPGMFRRVIERPDARFNQDLHPRMIILEIGSYDTDLDAALASVDFVAEVLADTVYGVRTGALPGVGPSR